MTTDSLVEKVEKDPVAGKAEEGDSKPENETGAAPVPAVVLVNVNVEAAADDDDTHDPFYPPIVSLPLVQVPTGEDGEREVFKKRARLYRYEHEGEPPEWKERGTGDIRIMMKEEDNTARILMRREKTMKVCANHHIKPWMDMKPNCGSNKAWVWKTRADYADEEPKQETLAVKFVTEENAKTFFDEFNKMKKFVLKMDAVKPTVTATSSSQSEEKELQGKMSDLQVSADGNTD